MSISPSVSGEAADEDSAGRRALSLTPASAIPIRPVQWLWESRVPLGTLALCAGREGIGKSTLAYTIAADVTRGRLRGHFYREPRPVIVAATEDSWSHTIVPRLMAADADLDLVYRVDVATADGIPTGLSLPRDVRALAGHIHELGVALVLLDPLMSRLAATLDTHKDAEVRLALEPLTALADRTGASVLGLIHLNKSTSTDPLTMVMGSRAFAAVARAVLFAVTDPQDEDRRLLGQPKNNLGRTDLPTLMFSIASQHVRQTDDGPITTGKLVWQGETRRTIADALALTAEGGEARTATDEAAAWLVDYLASVGGEARSADVKQHGKRAGHSEATLGRARKKSRVESVACGFPRETYWRLPLASGSDVSSGESDLTESTDPTGLTVPQSRQSDLSAQSDRTPREDGTRELSEVINELGGKCPNCQRFICRCPATSRMIQAETTTAHSPTPPQSTDRQGSRQEQPRPETERRRAPTTQRAAQQRRAARARQARRTTARRRMHTAPMPTSQKRTWQLW